VSDASAEPDTEAEGSGESIEPDAEAQRPSDEYAENDDAEEIKPQ
jgi:hypothetical protein